MAMGITYAGEIGHQGQGSTPQEQVELVCTDPRFVELAAAKKPNFVIRVIKGAWSYPRDWWHGLMFIACRAGFFGAEGKASTDAVAQKLEEQFYFAQANPQFTVRLVGILLKHAGSLPEFYARLAGGGITNYILTGGPYGAVLGWQTRLSIAVVNFIIAMLGGAVRAVENGADDLAGSLQGAFTGDYSPYIAQQAMAEAMQSARDNNYDISPEDEETILDSIDRTLDCLINPRSYLPSRVQHVPVGQVSSMRPPGVRGTIEAGYETNALDVIGDTNAMFRNGQ